MRVAVGEREAANAFGMPRCEDLRNGAAAVVCDQVHGFKRQRTTKSVQHVSLRAERQILRGAGARVPMRKQINGDTAAHVADAVNDMAPIITVQKYAVYE
jgi:hypothetical protein